MWILYCLPVLLLTGVWCICGLHWSTTKGSLLMTRLGQWSALPRDTLEDGYLSLLLTFDLPFNIGCPIYLVELFWSNNWLDKNCLDWQFQIWQRNGHLNCITVCCSIIHTEASDIDMVAKPDSRVKVLGSLPHYLEVTKVLLNNINKFGFLAA